MTKKFLIIDSNSILHRAYHALPPLKTKKGELVNAVYGFLLIFLRALKELKPDYIAAAFDLKGLTFRHKEYKQYKAKRPKVAEELYQQIDKVKKVLEAFNVQTYEKQGFEADDIIGTIVEKIKKMQIYPKMEIIILSGDLDLLQLVDEGVKVWTMKRGIRDIVLYGKKDVKERFQGLEPSQLIELKGLKGDASDNIPGVPGVGEKTAIQLIKKFKNLENLYQKLNQEESGLKGKLNEKLALYKEQAFLSRELSRIKKDVPLDFRMEKCLFRPKNQAKVLKILERLEFYTLIKRLPFSGASAQEKASQTAVQKDASQKKQKPLGGILLGTKKENVLVEIEELYKEGIFSEQIYQLEKKLAPIVKEMTENGIKLNEASLRALSEELDKRLKMITGKVYELAGEQFNLNSPQQVSEILFNKLKISSQKVKKTPKGALSTSSQELEKLKEAHPVVSLLLDYRELNKLKSGFCDSIVNFINPNDKRIHPRLHQLGAATGRMSCSEPNLQNIPTKGKLGREIRKCFVAEKGFLFISADYSQIELRIAASLSGDEKLIGLFQKRRDIHKMTAAVLFGVSEEKVSDKERGIAKSLNFAVLYGMGPKAFSERAKISFPEAKNFIKKYFEQFPVLAAYRSNLIEEARKQGYIATLFVRKRLIPEINSIDPRLKSQAERIAINTKIQGTASDIIKMAMVRLKEKGIVGNEAKLILQIHDELLFEVKKELVGKKIPQIKEVMEHAVELEVPLEVELKTGENWGEMKDVLK
jgi:DNA polymerase-1